jgi:large subunit ribosomal protein L19
LKEQLEREDMIKRRNQINIPEFYVGSIMAVESADPYAPNKRNRFVGICIRREDYGLRHTFTLRNVIDETGVEIQYNLYNPTIQNIDVLVLEKRLDDDLSYLQDCPDVYSKIPFDLIPVKLAPGAEIPINEIKV